MALSRRRKKTTPSADYWPGFVDAMATLLLVLIFLLSIFMLTQFFLAKAITGKDSALDALRSQMAELSSLLALEKRENSSLQATIFSLTDDIANAEAEKAKLSALISDGAGSGDQIASLQSDLDKERKVSSQALAQIELVNQQLSALRRQLATLEKALEASEAKDRESQTQIADLGKRLNKALARKVQELARYRSEFFGRLRAILGNRSDIEIVGDRFVFQSELFFSSGSAQVSARGQKDLKKIAVALREIATQIPDEVNWILRVDGHSDAAPINTAEFPSNWHLSAGRAISVVEFLVANGVPAKRLVAAGFGAYQPLSPQKSAEAYKRNRRIEFKLTQR
ncbi:MAG: peptidoglycan -binding protein [Parvibaculaceae bacterium]|nr:peptidoglycan -binding protein [Parvibaculaceae bacterium]